jgi:hypothetical protein
MQDKNKKQLFHLLRKQLDKNWIFFNKIATSGLKVTVKFKGQVWLKRNQFKFYFCIIIGQILFPGINNNYYHYLLNNSSIIE